MYGTISGSPGPLDRKDAIRPERQDILRRGLCWHNRHPATAIHQLPQDIVLDPAVIGDDMELRTDIGRLDGGRLEDRLTFHPSMSSRLCPAAFLSTLPSFHS